MYFDKVILNKICKFIDDPKTYLNFSLANKKLHRVAVNNVNQKMDEYIYSFGPGADCDCRSNGGVLSVLPNGEPHGVHMILSDSDETDDMCQLFFKGTLLSEWYIFNKSNFTFMKCSCQTIEYMFEKIGICDNKFDIVVNSETNEACKKCKHAYTKFHVNLKLN